MDNTFAHNFKGLSISVNERHMNINMSLNKKIYNNQYIPPHINDIPFFNTLNPYEENKVKKKDINFYL
jgi:hypothetical protein